MKAFAFVWFSASGAAGRSSKQGAEDRTKNIIALLQKQMQARENDNPKMVEFIRFVLITVPGLLFVHLISIV